MAVIVWKRNKTIKIVHFNNYFCISCFKFSCLKRWRHYFPFNPHFIIIFYYIKVVTTLLKAVTKQNLRFCLKWILYSRPPQHLEQTKETRQFPATILITNITTNISSLVLHSYQKLWKCYNFRSWSPQCIFPNFSGRELIIERDIFY